MGVTGLSAAALGGSLPRPVTPSIFLCGWEVVMQDNFYRAEAS